MALLKNPNLAVSASNVRIARYRIVQAKANFDVALHVEPSTNFSVTPPENLFFAGPGIGGSGYTCFNTIIGEPYPCSTTGPGISSNISTLSNPASAVRPSMGCSGRPASRKLEPTIIS